MTLDPGTKWLDMSNSGAHLLGDPEHPETLNIGWIYNKTENWVSMHTPYMLDDWGQMPKAIYVTLSDKPQYSETLGLELNPYRLYKNHSSENRWFKYNTYLTFQSKGDGFYIINDPNSHYGLYLSKAYINYAHNGKEPPFLSAKIQIIADDMPWPSPMPGLSVLEGHRITTVKGNNLYLDDNRAIRITADDCGDLYLEELRPGPFIERLERFKETQP